MSVEGRERERAGDTYTVTISVCSLRDPAYGDLSVVKVVDAQ